MVLFSVVFVQYPKRVNNPFADIHITIPIIVGIIKLTAVHLRLPVSLYMVIQEVEQGKWNSTKIIIHTAVAIVQPLAINISFSAESSVISVSAVL